MKKFYLLSFFFLPALSVTLQAQTDVFVQSINQVGIGLRGGSTILGQLNATFPSDGFVVVHFDGECYAAVGDRIVVAASNTGNWSANDGNVAIENSMPGFGRPFSHTRVYPVTAGSHTYYAVGQNAVELDGTGSATIHGTLTVEYFSDSSTSLVKSNGFSFNGDVTNSTVVAEQSIHVNAPGKILVRFDGLIFSDPGDRIVLAASNTMSWTLNYDVAVEALNAGDVDENSFSHTRVFNVSSAGDYTYYAVSQLYGETGGNHMITVYGNLLVEYYPTSSAEKLSYSGFILAPFDLNGQTHTLTSIDLNAPEAGKVMVVLDGYVNMNKGFDVILAASNNGQWSPNDGSETYQALDNDQNRYSFSHTRVYNVSAGNHTFYGVGESINTTDSTSIFGELTLKYFPNSATPVLDLTAEKNTFDIYPNPSNDVVHISFAIPSDQKIQLLDLNGRVLKEYRNNGQEEINIDMSGLPADLYWVKVGDICKPVVRM